MKIDYKIVNSVMYTALSGELDESSSHSVRAELDEIIDNNSFTKFVIDMSRLSFMDSTGIGVLIGRFKKLKEKKISLMIANPSNVVDKILNLSGIYQFMPKVVY